MARRRAADLSPLPPANAVAGLQDSILGWYAVNGRDLPWRRTRDPYAVLVSEVMLQQTQVPRVVPKYREFLAAFPALEALAAAPLGDVLRLWSGLGYNNRAARLRQAAQAVVRGSAAGEPAALPRTLEGLRTLPGVGPYTARAVLVFAHNADLAAVDANVRRVLTHELGLDDHLSPAALQAVADHVLPAGRSRDWHNALMDYGSARLTSRATGIAPRTRQSRFEGSRRQRRARLLRLLVEGGPQPLAGLPAALGVDAAEAHELVALLERDQLVHTDGVTVAIV